VTTSNSTDQSNSRYVQGGDTDRLSQRLGWWERKEMLFADDDITFEITPEYHHRPDKVAFVMYGNRDLIWLVLQYNTIIDIITEFVTGNTIRLPTPSRVAREILINQTGGKVV